jgi:multidrug resistance efflux pump
MRHRAPGLKLISSTIALVAFSLLGSFAAACRSTQSLQGDIAVNAPATGVVRSVLVADGASIEKDAAIIEIAVSYEQAGEQPGEQTNNQQRDKEAQRTREAIVARNDVVAAEADANRASLDLQRIEPLVKRGLASQAELDKARAQNQDAQARLQRARERAKSAEQQRNKAQTASGSNDKIISVRAPTAGKIHQISVQAGQQVTAGQTLARVLSGS